MTQPLLVGAVAYTPNVVTIWEGIRDYFAGPETEMDFVLFSNYGRQVDALVAELLSRRVDQAFAVIARYRLDEQGLNDHCARGH